MWSAEVYKMITRPQVSSPPSNSSSNSQCAGKDSRIALLCPVCFCVAILISANICQARRLQSNQKINPFRFNSFAPSIQELNALKLVETFHPSSINTKWLIYDHTAFIQHALKTSIGGKRWKQSKVARTAKI